MKKRGKFFQALNLALPFILVTALVTAIFIFLASHFLPFIAGFFSFSLPETPVVPREFTSTASQGSFTELFSGTGWMNKEKTDVYQDPKLSSISFPPDYEWQEVPALSDGLKDETIIAANGNGKEVVLIAKGGKIFEFQNDSGPIQQIGQIASAPLKDAMLDYDDSAGVWVVAASSESGIEVGPVNRAVPVNAPGSIDGLVCGNGECLLLAKSAINSFSIANPSALNKVNFPPGKSFESLSLGKAKNILIVGGVRKEGSTYNGSIFKYSAGSLSIINNQSLFSSPYPGTIRFGYDSENNQILAVYAAYIGQAYKFSVNPLLESGVPRISASTIEDFSSFFPQRVMNGNITPKIFKYGNAWWLSSEINQTSTKFIRIEGGAGVDFAGTLIRGQQSFELLPGFNPNELYAIVGSQSPKIYRFIDKGYKKDKKIVWESLRLNRFDNEIISGRFYEIRGGEEGGKIRYYLSNDGGKTWQETKLNEMVNFSKKGNDFRFKAELYPVRDRPRQQASATGTLGRPVSNGVDPGADKSKTPWLNLISVEYYSKP
ncbi:MAG: hypothetical protein Q7K44_01035 [Candidatus Liptonbacteria bacterium]|nr:hypothetical protein [Candidatus Liptonbacteria bacterium]